MLTEKSLSLEEALDLTLKCAEQSGYGEVTRKGFRGNLFTFMKWCSAQNVSCVGDINTALLKPYFLYLKEKQLSGYTVKSRCNSLRYLFGCLEEKGIIPDNPMNYLKICPRLEEKAWDVLTLEDMGLLLKGVEKRYQDASTEYKRSTLRDKLMLEMLLATGMRSCEIAALKVKDVDLEKGTVRIQGKGSNWYIKRNRCTHNHSKNCPLCRFGKKGYSPTAPQLLLLFDQPGSRCFQRPAAHGALAGPDDAAFLPAPDPRGSEKRLAKVQPLSRREDACCAGLIGSGWQAGAQLLALLAVRPVKEIKVYSLRKEKREAFVEEMCLKTGANIRSVESPEECVREVDIILAATSSLVPVIRPEWLSEGVHISCIKAQEVDEAVLNTCQRIVVHTRVQQKQIDNILPGTKYIPQEHEQGWWNKESLWESLPELSDLIAGRIAGRKNEKEITCFVNNVGAGLQFAALGALILKKAGTLGLGRELPGEWFSEDVHP